MRAMNCRNRLNRICGAILGAGVLALAAIEVRADQHAGRLPACDEGAEVRDLTLKDAVTVAYTGNPQLLSARQDVEKSKAAVTGSLTGFLPSGNFSMVGERFVSYLPGSVPVAVNNTIVGGQGSVFTSYPSVGVNWNLFAGGKDVAGYKGAEAGVRAAEGDLSDKTLTGLSTVLGAYSDLLKAQTSAQQQVRAVALLQKILERAESRFLQGRDSLLAVDQAKATLAQYERSYFDSCKTLSDRSAAMAQAVGVRMGSAQLLRAVTGALPEPPGAAVTPASFDSFVEQDPAVRAAKERVEVALRKLEQARAAFQPTVALFGRYDGLGQNAASFGDAYDATRKNSRLVGIVFQQPLGPFTSEYAGVESARADHVKADAMYQAALVDADNRLRSAWNGKRQSALALEAARRSALHAVQNQDLTEQLYGGGRVTEDAIDQSKILAQKELQTVRERELDDNVQGWLLYRATNTGDFERQVVRIFGGDKP
jgi:outer membrane protein TolC